VDDSRLCGTLEVESKLISPTDFPKLESGPSDPCAFW